MMPNSEARKRLAESPANEGGCVPCRVCGGDQSRGWHRHDSASERAAGELVADIDTLTVAIRRALDAGGFLVTERELAEALVAAGFGHIDAARREALLSAANEADSVGHHWSGAPALAFFALAGDLRDRAHQIESS